jgi:hypothetical protein
MAAMAARMQRVGSLLTTPGAGRPSLVWAWWVPVSVLGAVAGSLLAWQIRAFGGSTNSAEGLEALRYVGTIAGGMLGAGAQWWLLQRNRLDVYWWVPATVAAALFSDLFLIPWTLHLLVPYGSPIPSTGIAVLASAVALGAAGMLVGAVQALMLGAATGRVAWLWVASTALGGAMAGALTDLLSLNLWGLPPVAMVSSLAALSALLTAALQAPVLLRLLR